MRPTLLCCSTLALAAAVHGQSARVLPAGHYDNVFAGNNGTGTGYATQNGISQNLYIAPFAVGTIVQGVGFRRTATTVDFASINIDFELTLSSTVADLTTLSATFANNPGADATVVLPRQVVSIPVRAANSSPTDWVTLPTTPWPFGGPNFLVQCASYGSGGVNPWRMDRCFERPTVGEAITWGTACSSATVGSTSPSPAYMPGGTFDITLSGAAPGQPAFALLGFDLAHLYGAFPLPLDLSPLGMTGCTLLVDAAATLATATNAGGGASITVPIPSQGVTGIGLGIQWFYADPAASNPLRVLSTVGRLVHFGPLLCANRYVWSLTNVNATTGSLQAGGPVTQIITVP